MRTKNSVWRTRELLFKCNMIKLIVSARTSPIPGKPSQAAEVSHLWLKITHLKLTSHGLCVHDVPAKFNQFIVRGWCSTTLLGVRSI